MVWVEAIAESGDTSSDLVKLHALFAVVCGEGLRSAGMLQVVGKVMMREAVCMRKQLVCDSGDLPRLRTYIST